MSLDRRVNVQTFLNEHPLSAFQWTVFALCFFIVLLDGFDTAAIGYIAPSLIKGCRSSQGPSRRGRQMRYSTNDRFVAPTS